jgi:hypothetical protein
VAHPHRHLYDNRYGRLGIPAAFHDGETDAPITQESSAKKHAPHQRRAMIDCLLLEICYRRRNITTKKWLTYLRMHSGSWAQSEVHRVHNSKAPAEICRASHRGISETQVRLREEFKEYCLHRRCSNGGAPPVANSEVLPRMPDRNEYCYYTVNTLR